MINTIVKNFIEKYKLSGTFILAFSGGYDSMCLLDILYKSGYNIVAVHLNHNWRGEESFKEEENCRKFAEDRGINYYSEILPDNIAKTETGAREARYEFFRRCALKFNSNIVFTAHNYDDNAETVLYRIIKGTGTSGLQGILEHRDIFYRPILTIKRKDIENYCKENNLSPNVDSSNNNTKYKRNLIRHKVLNLLREINPNVTDALNSLSQIAKEDNEIINKYLPKNILDATDIEQKRIIYNILTQYNIEYDKEKIKNIQKFIKENKYSKSGKKISLTKDLWLFVSEEKVELVTKTGKSNNQIQINKCGEYNFENYTFSIKEYSNQITDFPKDTDFTAYISTDDVNFTLRHRKDGDRIYPLGLNGGQKLKKYLNEKKIPQHEKDKLIFLCKGNEIFWAAGLGISEKIKVVQTPTHVISLRKR